MKKIEIYDTTLRDGSQTEGISYSLQDKINIAKKLDDFGVNYIEGGWPYSNLKDTELFAYFKKNPLKNSKLVPFGSTAHPANPASEDQNLASLVGAGTEYVTIFGKTWDLHVTGILRIKLEDNLKMIRDSVAFLKKNKKKIFYDAEHFFDGYKANPEYALKTILEAKNAGAELIVFCDTNGGTLPQDIERMTKEAIENLGLAEFGMHCHNDLGLGVANSVACIDRGCVHIQGTINGYGERCGNADLVTIMGILQLKMKKSVVTLAKMKELTKLSHYVSEVSNMSQNSGQPFTGQRAFAHKGGIHIDAVIKNPLAYEHVEPETVGNNRKFVVSELAGKSTLVSKAKELEYDLDKKSDKAKEIHKLLQRLENEGYQFEAAEGSFKLLLHKNFRQHKTFFDLLGFKVSVEKRQDNTLVSEATIKLEINGKVEHTASKGDGPVNALDNALRKALLKSYPSISKMHLTDFKVRVLDEKSGTATKVRVLIQSQDEKDSWSTIGVSENIIEASWQALTDSIEYKLLKDKKWVR